MRKTVGMRSVFPIFACLARASKGFQKRHFKIKSPLLYQLSYLVVLFTKIFRTPDTFSYRVESPLLYPTCRPGKLLYEKTMQQGRFFVSTLLRFCAVKS